MHQGMGEQVSGIETEAPLAHSARELGGDPDPYVRHVQAVRSGVRKRTNEMLRFALAPPDGLPEILDAAAMFHDLGKLDDENQAALRKGRGHRLKWDHIDAGVAHLMAIGCPMAAWLVRAHHAPGLPQKSHHFDPDDVGRKLRGRRNDDDLSERHNEQRARTDAELSKYVAKHRSLIPEVPTPIKSGTHGLAMRLALSCLVDADHADTAFFDSGTKPIIPASPRWEERLEQLCGYIHRLPVGETSSERERNKRRRRFFDSCLNSALDDAMVACEGPVGVGKTTAITAYLIRRARDEGLRRLIIVAPYTNILSQTAERLRSALVLPGEDPYQVIVEHHHRADFDNQGERELTILWQAPIVLTTAVSFFETLSSCDPSSLRKLHAVPGSAVFLDEAHAALPTNLWPQNFEWLRTLAEQWMCRFVFASGSLVRFWEQSAGIIAKPTTLPELLPHDQAADLFEAEKRRVSFERMNDGCVVSVEQLVEFVERSSGPRLVILNTVQNAAVVARSMRDRGIDVLHLSTALTPRDRIAIIEHIFQRLSWRENANWSLVATSCVEAGIDLSFRTAFRERFAAASIVQTGGRVNRHGEHEAVGGSIVYDFALEGSNITQHPAAMDSGDILRGLLNDGVFNTEMPADIVTRAMRDELRRRGGPKTDLLVKAERERNYPLVAELGRVITADTRFVIVDSRLQQRLQARDKVSFREILIGSVQLWSNRIEDLRLDPIWPDADIYVWKDAYDPDFLGYMDGVLRLKDFLSSGGGII